MKIFVVVMEYINTKEEVENIIQYVSGDALGTVSNYFQAYADTMDYNLIEVKYLFNISEHIK